MKQQKCRRGSLTAEAALILPVYAMGLLALLSILLMFLTGMRIQSSLLDLSEELAMELSDGHSIPLSEVEDRLAESLSEEDLKFIENGKDGLDMTGSNTGDGEYIELCVKCNLVPVTGSFGICRIPFTRRSLTHIWCGYDSAYFPEEEYVYVTKNSKVYHRDRECSHIKLTVKETTSDKVGDLRNNNGGRYKPCSLCHSSLSDGRLYIAAEGDRYHNTLTCSGLKRTVRAIKISEVGNRKPCKRCGK